MYHVLTHRNTTTHILSGTLALIVSLQPSPTETTLQLMINVSRVRVNPNEIPASASDKNKLLEHLSHGIAATITEITAERVSESAGSYIFVNLVSPWKIPSGRLVS